MDRMELREAASIQSIKREDPSWMMPSGEKGKFLVKRWTPAEDQLLCMAVNSVVCGGVLLVSW
jgi:hypothetical protein